MRLNYSNINESLLLPPPPPLPPPLPTSWINRQQFLDNAESFDDDDVFGRSTTATITDNTKSYRSYRDQKNRDDNENDDLPLPPPPPEHLLNEINNKLISKSGYYILDFRVYLKI